MVSVYSHNHKPWDSVRWGRSLVLLKSQFLPERRYTLNGIELLVMLRASEQQWLMHPCRTIISSICTNITIAILLVACFGVVLLLLLPYCFSNMCWGTLMPLLH